MLLVALTVPGWCLLTLLQPKQVGFTLALPASAGLSLAIVSVAAWLGWITHTGFAGVAAMTTVAVLAIVGARIMRRRGAAPFVRPVKGDLGPSVLALGAVVLALVDGPWLSQTADQFYHLAATRTLLQARAALPMQVFFGVPVPYPDDSSGSLHVVAAWTSLVTGLIPAWAALAVIGAAFIALAFAAFAREITGSTLAAAIASALYLLFWLNFDFRTSGYPNHLGPGLVWLTLVFVIRYARSPGRSSWPDLAIAALLAIAAGSVHSGMAPFIVVLGGVTYGAAALVQLWRRDLRPLWPLSLAGIVVLAVTLPLLVIRLIALPTPGADGWLFTEAPPIVTHVLHGYPFVDFRFWFDGVVTISTVGTVLLLGHARRAWLKGDPGGALLVGGILIVPALCVTPLLPRFADSLYYFARIAELLRPLCFIPMAWELAWAAPRLATWARARRLPPGAGRLDLAAVAVLVAIAALAVEYVPQGAYDKYFGPGNFTVAASHHNDLTHQWADRLSAIDNAGSGTLLANLDGSYEIAGLTGNPIVGVAFSHIPYQDFARDGMLRLGDVLDAMRPADDRTLLMSILVRYRVSLVMVDLSADGKATWNWMAAQPALVPVAEGGGWRLYRFDRSRLDQELNVPLTGAAAVAPSRTFAGRAVFARFTFADTHGEVVATGLSTGAVYRAPFDTTGGQAGTEQTSSPIPVETVTEPLLFPEGAPVDSYRITVDTGGGAEVSAGTVRVGRDYEAESFAGIIDYFWNGGFIRNPGWLTRYGAFSRGVAVVGLHPLRVASKPLLDPPGDYCLDVRIFDEGDGRSSALDVSAGGDVATVSWGDHSPGLRDLTTPLHVGAGSHELSFWVPNGSAVPVTVDYLALWPASGGQC